TTTNGDVSYTATWHVTSSNGQVISDVSQTFAASHLSSPSAIQVQDTLQPSGSGLYTITLTVTDSLGISRSVTTTETVGTPLTLEITQGNHPVSGTITTTLDAPITLSASGGSTYSWQATVAGTSTPVATGSASTFTFSLASPGTYTVILTASDAAGNVA